MSSPTSILPRTSLYFTQGGSDKEYHAQIEAAGPGFVVNFQFGRRGTTLQTGTKTPAPVDLSTATKIYDKLVKEKTAKGYTPGESGTPYSAGPKEERITGILPQLLNSIDEAEALALIDNPAWLAQEKLDGKRLLLRKAGESVTGINRKGLAVSLPSPIIEAARRLGGDFLLDGEIIGDVYHAFDCLENKGIDVRHRPLVDRLCMTLVLPSPGKDEPIRFVYTEYDQTGKARLLQELKARKAEGIIFKRADAPYAPGRPNTGGPALKFKFTQSASCIVAGPNGSKRSVYIDLLDESGQRANVGKVTIPGKLAIPPAGSLIEVRYLYAYKGGCLFQPVYLGPRDDVSIDACTLAQLKYKADVAEEDEAPVTETP